MPDDSLRKAKEFLEQLRPKKEGASRAADEAAAGSKDFTKQVKADQQAHKDVAKNKAVPRDKHVTGSLGRVEMFEQHADGSIQVHVKGVAAPEGHHASDARTHSAPSDSTALIKEAATVAVSVGKMPYDYNYAVLEDIAAQKGLLNETIVFSKVISASKQLAAASQTDDDQVRPSTICIAVLLTVLASGFGQATLSEFSLNRLNRDFMKRAMKTTDNQLLFALLNSSISVDLMQNNFETAVVKSEYLPQLADGNSLPALTLPSKFDWLAKRRKVILRREIFSGALAAAIGIVFV